MSKLQWTTQPKLADWFKETTKNEIITEETLLKLYDKAKSCKIPPIKINGDDYFRLVSNNLEIFFRKS